MIRSLFTAIGGLKNHQVMMDVTANNIANVNTVGYKSERASFASMLSQTVRGASGPQASGLGGINPTQVGLGVALQGIQSLLTQGSLQTTGQWNDLAIQGDGYFVVSQTKPAGGAPTDTEFTRAGNFTVDVNGDLVTQGGEYVLGSSMAAAGPPRRSTPTSVRSTSRSTRSRSRSAPTASSPTPTRRASRSPVRSRSPSSRTRAA